MDSTRRAWILTALGLLVVLVVGLGGLLWSRTPSEPGPAATTPAPPRTLPPSTEPEPAPAPDLASPAAQEPVDPPRSPHEQALRAFTARSGLEWVRCPLPDDIAETRLDGASWSSVHDGVLSLAVDGPGAQPLRPHVETGGTFDMASIQDLADEFSAAAEAGNTADLAAISEDLADEADAFTADLDELMEQARPIAFARIDRAPDGRLTCEVVPPDALVEVAVTVVDPGGGPVGDTFVAGLGSHAMTDSAGQGFVSVLEGTPTPILAHRLEGDGGARLQGQAVSRGEAVRIVLDPAPSTQDLIEQIREDARQHRDHLDLAMAQDDLTDASRDWLERWRGQAEELLHSAEQDPVLHHAADGSIELHRDGR